MNKKLVIIIALAVLGLKPTYGQIDDNFNSFNFDFISDSSFNQMDTVVIRNDFISTIEMLKRTEDYKFLRQYKNKKEALLRQNEKALGRYQRKIFSINQGISYNRKEYNYIEKAINEINRMLAQPTFEPNNRYLNIIGLFTSYNQTLSKDEIKAQLNQVKSEQINRLDQIQRDSVSLIESKKILQILIQNKQNIESDIDECISAIDAAIAPEYKNQSFKRQISIAFSLLIGVLIIIFFVIVYKRSDNSISVILLSDGGLQFVTIFVLIIAVILFGVLDILKSNELSAILSGIAGYILGKSGKIPSNNTNQLPPQNNSSVIKP